VTPSPELFAVDELDEADDWAGHDLLELATAMRDGTYQPITPTILQVEGSTPLLYDNRINGFFGDPTSGKTWLAECAAVEVLRNGGRVLWIDYEDNPRGTVERLVLSFELTDDELARFDYRNPTSGIGRGLETLAAETLEYRLAVVDSTGEAMAAGGVNGNDDDAAANWFRMLKQLHALPGQPAILVIDHTPKDPNAPKLSPIASQRKKAAITGALYRVDTVIPFAKGKSGLVKLTTAKDRNGNRPTGDVACEVDMTAANVNGYDVLHPTFRLTESQQLAAQGKPWRPTVLMERISQWLELYPGATRTSVETSVEGNGKALRDAMDALIADGYVTKQDGPHGASLLTVSKQYRRDISDPAPIAQALPDLDTDPF
jgi:hypothetical protein